MKLQPVRIRAEVLSKLLRIATVEQAGEAQIACRYPLEIVGPHKVCEGSDGTLVAIEQIRSSATCLLLVFHSIRPCEHLVERSPAKPNTISPCASFFSVLIRVLVIGSLLHEGVMEELHEKMSSSAGTLPSRSLSCAEERPEIRKKPGHQGKVYLCLHQPAMMFDAPFPPEMQSAFAIPSEFDGPTAVLSSVRLSQHPRPWYRDSADVDVCAHDIYIGGREVNDGPNWETRRSKIGYSIWLSRDTVFIDRQETRHRCPSAYEDQLLSTIYRELTTIRAPKFAEAPAPTYQGFVHVFASHERPVTCAHRRYTSRFTVDAPNVKCRSFARSIEAIVRDLTPDFKVTKLSLGAWPRHLLEPTPVAATAAAYQ